MSFCVITTLFSSDNMKQFPSLSSLFKCLHRFILTFCLKASSLVNKYPSFLRSLAFISSDIASMSPEPHSPLGFSAFPSSSIPSMIFPFTLLIFTEFIAPGAARIPERMPLPSNAGPAAVEVTNTFPEQFNKISAFVPISIAISFIPVLYIFSLQSTAAASAPT